MNAIGETVTPPPAATQLQPAQPGWRPVLAVLLPLGYARGASLLLVAGVVLGAGLTVASLWWVLTRRGAARVAAGALAVAAPVGVVWWFAVVNLLWVVIVSAALWGVAVWSGSSRVARASAASNARAKSSASAKASAGRSLASSAFSVRSSCSDAAIATGVASVSLVAVNG